ncbi:uncharacterized protein IWZ02DRAFT_148507 [Phyllosticta citriasiana]|uniref:uncharacterized protein n=1 Tax=Phyllosticta citriasiana TaxID=595635 RepID=UPI0030FDAD87
MQHFFFFFFPFFFWLPPSTRCAREDQTTTHLPHLTQDSDQLRTASTVITHARTHTVTAARSWWWWWHGVAWRGVRTYGAALACLLACLLAQHRTAQHSGRWHAWRGWLLSYMRCGTVRYGCTSKVGRALKILSSLGCRIFLRGRVGAVGWVMVGGMWVGWISKGWMG